MGCMVGKREAEDLAERFPFVDVFTAPSQIDALIDAILQQDAYKHLSKAQVELADYRLPAVNREKAVTAFVPVTLGCSHVCSYCVIPHRRGPDRSRMPDASINTDVIVGYPTETEEDFLETMKLADELRLDMHHIAKYSPRPRTLSAKMKDDVPPEVKEERRIRLDELVTQINAEKSAELLGQTVEVLVEEFQENKNRWRGRTPHNKLVFFESDADCLGQLVNVKITWTGPFSLIGSPVKTAAI
jgi:tRNA A37 methylthiotransferase MiaB